MPKNSVAAINTSRSAAGNRATATESSSSGESSISTVHILERAQGGDRLALQTLIDRAMPPVRRWARGRLPQYARQDANTEDVVQDAVLRTIKNIKRVRSVTLGGVQAYLRQSIVNRIRDLIRGKKRRGIPIELHDNLPDHGPSPLEAAIRRERHDRFLDALRCLSPTDRQVVVWRLELGYSVEEIAPRLGKSKAAAGMTVTRAVGRLAKQLDLAPR